ncbi:hypothetical protein M409DRAFT_29190 [Zasmidium cellare ATCC 36951]|uniref:Aminotransferase class I/classII large domain-containing protein n=1 Tax=Zasmidium cellare ATCC 36951 TaxID=1080233 RepID=A0A6A6C2D7_ZASCE|nr:uncharacterized protein M409DRAFT_29190 [Zasmidium cellare ATCC 36951]KAF2160340.1 hypothetical protein M409DRAFT_29190 [Zasmidium cellare ATCC 36951]
MLSHRGSKAAAIEELPWRFAPGKGDDQYDPIHNPGGVIGFGTAENCLIHKELFEYLQSKTAFTEDILTYRYSTNGGERFQQAIASHLNRHLSPVHPVGASQLITASSLTAIHEMLGFCLGDPGDGILVIPPIYGRFELDFGNTDGLRIVYTDMDEVDPFEGADDIVVRLKASLVKAAASGTVIRALMIVNPNNPLGRCYPKHTIRSLLRFCQDHGLHYISDEVYALSVYEGEEDEDVVDFHSVLSIDTTGLIDASRVHVLYGLSKDFGAAGLRIGCLFSRNSLLHKSMMSMNRFHPPSGPALAMASTILEDGAFVDKLMALSRRRLSLTRKLVISRLRAAGIDWHRGGNAGFFVYVDLSPWLPHHAENPEFKLAEKLLRHGVGLHPCEEHYGKPGWFRIVFSAVKQNTLEEGLRRLVTALGPKPALPRLARVNGENGHW